MVMIFSSLNHLVTTILDKLYRKRKSTVVYYINLVHYDVTTLTFSKPESFA